MSYQPTRFPLFFTVEHVNNGYVLTARDENTEEGKADTYHKEVVMEDKINARIGQLFHFDAFTNEYPISFRVEAISKNTYQMDCTTPPDELIKAKLTFVHFHSKDLVGDTILALLIEDTQTIEIYGSDAEKAARNNNAQIVRVGGIPMLRFANTKDGKKLLASYCARTTVMSVKHEQVLKWYREHPLSYKEMSK